MMRDRGKVKLLNFQKLNYNFIFYSFVLFIIMNKNRMLIEIINKI